MVAATIWCLYLASGLNLQLCCRFIRSEDDRHVIYTRLVHLRLPTSHCPLNALAASSFGTAFPNPQPPSLSCATIAPAHLPLLNPQHLLAQSASFLHTPVINCVPAATVAFPLAAEVVTVTKPILDVDWGRG